MKSWNLIFRRTHLFLGMLLIPWMLVYALSAFTFNHYDSYFRQFQAPNPRWIPLWDKVHPISISLDNAIMRETAQRVLDDHGLGGRPFVVERQGQRLIYIHLTNFRQPTRLTYEIEPKTLRAEKMKFAWVELFTRLHYRVGYGPAFLNSLWAFIVDVFCVTTLVWIGTGLYLWWKLTGTRRWGFFAMGGGLVTILILLASL